MPSHVGSTPFRSREEIVPKIHEKCSTAPRGCRDAFETLDAAAPFQFMLL